MILIDMHPAELLLPDGTRHELVRVVLTDKRIRVWAEVGRQPQLLVDEAHDGVRLESQYPVVGQPIQVGGLAVTRMRGCGCGSSLKGLRPPTDEEQA